MENIVHGLALLNEIDTLLRYESDEESLFFEVPRKRYVLEIIQIILEVLYSFVIIVYKGVFASNFYITAYVGLCTASSISKAWNLYRTIYEHQKLRFKMNSM